MNEVKELIEMTAIAICEAQLKDSFNGDYVTDRDRERYRECAKAILQSLAEAEPKLCIISTQECHIDYELGDGTYIVRRYIPLSEYLGGK